MHRAGKFTVNGLSFAEIVFLLINIEVCEGGWLQGTNFINE